MFRVLDAALARSRAVPVVLVLALLASACGGSSGKTAAPSSTSLAGAASAAVTVPPGTTLRIGDQLELQQTVLSAGGQTGNVPYTVKWAAFVGGPAMLQAFQADAIDIGYVGDTPLIFAQAAHQDIVAVAAWASEHGTNELVAAPGSKINSWRDVKGKKIAFQQGTSLEAALLQGLHKAGLSLKDITPVHLPLTQIAAALQGGSVDGGILVPPLDRAYLSSTPAAKVVDRSDDLTNRVSFIIASKSALADKAKAAAIRDYVQRIVRAYKSIAANPDAFIQSFLVGKYHLPPDAARQFLQDTGTTTLLPIPGTLLKPQQELADLYTAAGEIPGRLDVRAQFDGRFNDVLQQEATR